MEFVFRGGLYDMSAINGADPATLIPDSKPDFFTYLGSLTVPPLFESVIWINFLEPITFSQVNGKNPSPSM